jgi:hypothetical protein
VGLVVDVGEVSGGGALTDTAELVVDGAVAQADPALVCTEIWNGDASEMSANSGNANE